MGLNPQQRRKNQTAPLQKKITPKVSNGLSLEYCKNNHHQLHSDQENNPQLVHRHGKRKKKHHKKKHAWVSYNRPYLQFLLSYGYMTYTMRKGK